MRGDLQGISKNCCFTSALKKGKNSRLIFLRRCEVTLAFRDQSRLSECGRGSHCLDIRLSIMGVVDTCAVETNHGSLRRKPTNQMLWNAEATEFLDHYWLLLMSVQLSQANHIPSSKRCSVKTMASPYSFLICNRSNSGFSELRLSQRLVTRISKVIIGPGATCLLSLPVSKPCCLLLGQTRLACGTSSALAT